MTKMKVKNYGGFPKEFTGYEKSPIVVLPVAYDGTSTWIKGADKGPQAIIDASPNMEFYDIETATEVCEKGISTDKVMSGFKTPESMIEAVRKRTSGHLSKGKFVVLLGGEHSVSIGAVKAHAEAFKEFSVLQLDAHSDLRDEYEGSMYNHACVMARVKEMCPIVQVGIRAIDSGELPNMDKGRVFFAEHIHDNDKWFDKAISQLRKNVYVTIDLDVFDPSIIPATGTPEPGGLGWYQVLRFLKKVGEQRNIVGFDVVELCPQKESKVSDFTASKLVYKLLSYKFGKK
jgi:agmatinase